MLTMAKKTPKSEPADDQELPEMVQFPVRLERPLLVALDRHAKQSRRSRNMAITLLVEDTLRALGLWPES